jgi:hypothetical protein
MGVRYDVIPALLLNEMLKQARDNQRKDARIAALQKQLFALAEPEMEWDRRIEYCEAS